MIEAQELGASLMWPRRMTIDDRAEFERLKTDGHVFVEMKRYFRSELLEDSVRNTMLYRTLLHELGHMVHYHNDVIDRRTALNQVQSVAEELYFSKPSSEREAFAHAFADKVGQSLRASGAIPFTLHPV